MGNYVQSALTTFAVLCGVVLIPFIAPPIKTRIGSDAFLGDWRPSLLAFGLLAGYAVVLAIAPLRTLFDLAPLSTSDYALIGIAGVVWVLGLCWAWRVRLIERFLQLDGR